MDNSATTLQKPPEVAKAVAEAINSFGNPGRSFCTPSLKAGRSIFEARREIAGLTGLSDPARVAFTSSATESLNLVLHSLITSQDSVITTVLEHNSVLRPLYDIGCHLSILGCDDAGNLLLDELKHCLRPNTRFVVCTHGSNLIGSITDTQKLSAFCKTHGLILILDVSQTLGSIPVAADMADIICFTGHKALFGPQGTGGIIIPAPMPLRPIKTGGSGFDSFSKTQPSQMPDIFEAGTQNAHSLAGLAKGTAFVRRHGIETIIQHETALTMRFIKGIRQLQNVQIYGPVSGDRLPVVSVNIGDLEAGETALRLWEEFKIATRSGSHCAPLTHKRFNTETRGMVRFSFSFFTTEKEIDQALNAIAVLADQ